MSKGVQYKPRDWSQYNKNLTSRGNFSLWLDSDDLQNWLDDSPAKGSGSSRHYSDRAIQCISTFRFLFKLPLRATQGFITTLFSKMGINLPIPHYSTISRRLTELECPIPQELDYESPLHLALDSTGLKVFGEGEWKVRQHGYSKRRTWRKVHLAVDTETKQIINAVISTNDIKDNEVINDLLHSNEADIKEIYGDGAYDTKNVYNCAKKKGIRIVVPPRKNAKLKLHGNCKQEPLVRDQAIRKIKRNGKQAWKEENNYHKRSISEMAMFRLKSLFGGKLSSRTFANQASEVFIKCGLLNVFAIAGLANSKPVLR